MRVRPFNEIHLLSFRIGKTGLSIIFLGKSLPLQISRIYKAGIALIFLGFFVSCAPLQIEDEFTEPLYASSLALDYEELVIPELGEGDIIADRAPTQSLNPFPIDNNSIVRWWLAYYAQGKGRQTMKIFLERSGRYRDYMSRILYQEGLPPEFVYMSMLESGFKATAVSHAKAVGYWQFIYSTAKIYDLKMNRQVDERRDFNDSTLAAARHLRDLYYDFKGDWRLAMAAYNCGKKCVSSAIQKYKTNNYWSLVQKKALPKETRQYVPKVMAMAQIGQRPEYYGFYQIRYAKPLNYDILEIDSDISISQLTRELNISKAEFKQLNPKFKTDRILASQNSYVRIPRGLSLTL